MAINGISDYPVVNFLSAELSSSDALLDTDMFKSGFRINLFEGGARFHKTGGSGPVQEFYLGKDLIGSVIVNTNSMEFICHKDAQYITLPTRSYGFENSRIAIDVDAEVDLFSPSRRGNTPYFANQLSSISDVTYKTPIRPVDERVLSAISEFNIYEFEYLDSVDRKGVYSDENRSGARTHFNISAQELIAKFEKHGLDPFKYAVIRTVKWNEESAEYNEEGVLIKPEIDAGQRYEIVDSELHMLILKVLINKVQNVC